MARYIIGDIQGCYQGLRALLEKVAFTPSEDTLYAVGDLVARGEDSLSTLRYLKSLGSSFQSVLGNHDLHLLSVANSVKPANKKDKLKSLLDAPDLVELIDWLRQFPLAMRLSEKHVMVHAGLFPKWSTEQLLALSDEVSHTLQSADYIDLLENMYGSGPSEWDDSLTGFARLRFIINACTRMRFLTSGKALEMKTKCGPKDAPKSLTPWYKVTNKKLGEEEQVFFGHWAALEGMTKHPHYIGLDTGYVWGNTLTLYCLDNQRFYRTKAN